MIECYHVQSSATLQFNVSLIKNLGVERITECYRTSVMSAFISKLDDSLTQYSCEFTDLTSIPSRSKGYLKISQEVNR